MKNVFKFLKTLIIIIGVVLLGIAIVVSSVFFGKVLRWLLYVICFIIDIFNPGEQPIIEWIYAHDMLMLVICSILAGIYIVSYVLEENTSMKINYSRTSGPGTNTISDIEVSKNLTFVDASGAYRRWGEDFIDCQGNWCQWGSGFYDYDENYIYWGNTYKDSSGAYRRWGEDFVDGDGNWVHL